MKMKMMKEVLPTELETPRKEAGFSQQQWMLLVLALVLGIVTVLTLDKAGWTPQRHAAISGAVHANTIESRSLFESAVSDDAE